MSYSPLLTAFKTNLTASNQHKLATKHSKKWHDLAAVHVPLTLFLLVIKSGVHATEFIYNGTAGLKNTPIWLSETPIEQTLYPGTTAHPSASHNHLTVNFTSGIIPSMVLGGLSNQTSGANHNTVIIKDGGVQAALYGGYNRHDTHTLANHNTITIEQGYFTDYLLISAGYAQSHTPFTAQSSTNKNQITINGGNFGYETSIAGGTALGSKPEANTNSVTINAGNFDLFTSIYGGFVNNHMQGQTYSQANNNHINLHGGVFEEFIGIYGGYSHGATEKGLSETNANRITVTGGRFKGHVTIHGGDAAADAKSPSVANDNAINVTGVTFEARTRIAAGTSFGNGNSQTNNNQISLSQNNFDRTSNLYGGHSVGIDGSQAHHNQVVLEGNIFSRDSEVYGAYNNAISGVGSVLNNRVSISGNTQFHGDENVLYGAYGTGAKNNIAHNQLHIDGALFNGYASLYGGYGTSHNEEASNVTTNLITINQAIFKQGLSATGGYSDSMWDASSASDNTIKLNNVVVQLDPNHEIDPDYYWEVNDSELYGGYSEGVQSIASDNQITIEGGELTGLSSIFGGYSMGDISAIAERNRVVINDATFFSPTTIVGGFAKNSTDNKILINGGHFHADLVIAGGLYTGSDPHSTAINNHIIITGTPIFEGLVDIHGGRSTAIDTDIFSGNTLTLNNHGFKAHNVAGFEFYEFFIPATVTNGSVLLEATGDVVIEGAKIEVKQVAAATPLQFGDAITLIQAENLIGTGILRQSTLTQGISLIYDVALTQSDDRVVATISDFSGQARNHRLPARTNPHMKVLSSGHLAARALLNQGADLVAEQGLAQALRATHHESGMLHTFATYAGGKNRYKTGIPIDLKGHTVTAGTALRSGGWVLGGFMEGGRATYNSHTHFHGTHSVYAKGTTHYYGIGLLTHYQFDHGLSLEGALRLGKASTDFKSRDLVNTQGVFAQYKQTSTYHGAHIGVGYDWQVNPQSRLNLSGKYLWGKQGGKAQQVAGDPINFAAINSSRLQVASRLFHELSPQVTLVMGAGYEHEFNGTAKATTYHHYNIDAPSLKGGSGLTELGLNFHPTLDKKLTLETRINGYLGRRAGVAGQLQLRYTF